MTATDIVDPPGRDAAPPSRLFSFKQRGGETGESIMMSRKPFPPGRKAPSICITTATRLPMC